ncbi:MAG: lysophospholipid acyltransferase family protein [Bacteroidota bacterium]
MAEWTGKSIGPLIGYRFFLFAIRTFGIRFSYFVLNFVTAYYFRFVGKIGADLIQFYQQTLGLNKQEAATLARRNLVLFGQTLVDRAAFRMGKANQYSYEFINEDLLLAIKDQGAVMLSAHLGNWETAGNLLRNRVSSRINVVMLDAEAEKIKQIMNQKTGGAGFSIIPVKDDLSHIIRIKNVLSDRELVAIHADRTSGGSRSIPLEFMGKTVNFPYGPFLIASKFDVPVTFVYSVKTGDRSYRLSATTPITKKQSPEEVAKAYVTELESMFRQYPEQWFNYYNFLGQ